MSNNIGLNGWINNGMFQYYGKNYAVSECENCRKLLVESGTVGGFNYNYQCKGSTSSAGARLGEGKSVTKCEDFMPVTADNPRIGTGSIKGALKNDIEDMGGGAIIGAVKVAGFVGKGAVALGRAAKRLAILMKEKKLKETYSQLSSISFDGEKNIINGLKKLFEIFNVTALGNVSGFKVEDRWDIADLALIKIEEGIRCLRDTGDENLKKVDDFQMKYQKSMMQRLEIQTMSGQVVDEFKNYFTGDKELKKCMTLVECISFASSKKLIVKSIDSLFSVVKSIPKCKAKLEDRKNAMEGVIERIQEGIAELQTLGFDQKKLEKYESNLKKLQNQHENLKPSLTEKLLKKVL